MGVYAVKIPCNNGNHYQIRYQDRKHGNNIFKSKVVHVPEGMKKREQDKWLRNQKQEFEKQCEQGYDYNLTFGQLMDIWDDEYAKEHLKGTTYSRYRQIMPEVRVKFGNMKLREMKTHDIQVYINGLSKNRTNQHDKEKKLSRRTIEYYKTLISSIMGYAVKQQLIEENICKHVNIPEGAQKERQIYTMEETAQFMEAMKTLPVKFQAIYMLAIFNGLRRGEILGLKWSDFNFEKRFFTVQRCVYHTTEKGTYVDTPKTKKSVRSLNLSNSVLEVLKALRAEQHNEQLILKDRWKNQEGWLFTDWEGEHMNPDTPYRKLKKFCKANNLPCYGLHSFRHLNASIMIHEKVDPRTVSAVMGHSRTSTTVNIYSHEIGEASIEAGAEVAAVIEKAMNHDKYIPGASQA